MKKTLWSLWTKKIFNGILLLSLAWVVRELYEPVVSYVSGMNTLETFAGISGWVNASILIVPALSLLIVTLIIIMIGCLLVVAGLKDVSGILEEADRKPVADLRVAFILLLVAAALQLVPLAGVISDVVSLAAAILMLSGYHRLEASPTFPGKDGASILSVAMILIIVGWVFDFIPLIGDWIESALVIVAYVLTVVGWHKIKNVTV
ncbi:MAG: hypothetical protein LBF09_07630 [Odoribacteraceae bacterium]|nr:hypothetical protein [Odoribacteraceae bacterium]